MNFVIFSYNFLPLADAEAYCTTRFASALAETGHNVHVVTMDHPNKVSQEVVDLLLSPKLKITRVPMKKLKKRLLPRLKYLTPEWGSADYDLAIETLRGVLKSYDKPILISRSNPESSHIIAYHARKDAWKWIAHFSDPIPFGTKAVGLKNRLWLGMTLRWMRKAIKEADGFSLTCDEVKPFYCETYGRDFSSKPQFVNHHIGEPKLPAAGEWTKPFSEKLIVHAGMINPARGVCEMLDALEELNHDSLKVRFIQVGECARETARFFEGRPDAVILQTDQPGLGAKVVESADISFIPDVQIDMSYTPFMPSKFVYQLFSEKPLVLLTREGSPMWNYAKRYPNSGLFVADYTKPGSLTPVLRAAMTHVGEEFNRTELRRDFTRAKVASDFVEKLKCAF